MLESLGPPKLITNGSWVERRLWHPWAHLFGPAPGSGCSLGPLQEETEMGKIQMACSS